MRLQHLFIPDAKPQPLVNQCICNCAVVAYFVAAFSSTMAIANAALPALFGFMMYLIGLIIRKQGESLTPWTPLKWQQPLLMSDAC